MVTWLSFFLRIPYPSGDGGQLEIPKAEGKRRRKQHTHCCMNRECGLYLY